ncbi:MAG: hypothetical protein EXS36_18370 [Pedosphaera sp.]|nr:hypothetical protein [Pedosphaera sp.]
MTCPFIHLFTPLFSFQGVPVFGVFDLHANFTARMAAHANGLVGYRENSHTDARESAVRAVHLLDRSLRTGQRPKMFFAHPPIVWPPTGTATNADPMKSLLLLARSLENRHPEFWEVSSPPGGGLWVAENPSGREIIDWRVFAIKMRGSCRPFFGSF